MAPIGPVGSHGRPACGAGRPSRDTGQATLELATLMPMIVLVVLALVQISLLGVSRIGVTAAEREAARTAAVTSDLSRVREAAEKAVPGTAGLQVRVAGERSVGEHISVTVAQTVRPQVPLVSVLFPSEIRMAASASMAVEVP